LGDNPTPEEQKILNKYKELNGTPVATNESGLRLGSTGDEVKELQQWLYDYGFYVGAVDGNFGNETEKAVKVFQEEAGLLPDGMVGPETKKMMEKWDSYIAQVQAYSTTQGTQSYSRSDYTKSFRNYYSGGRGTGDCWDNSEYLYNKLTSSGSDARIIQYSTSQSSRHRSVQVYEDGEWVNYDYKANGYAQTYYATSNSVNGVVVKG
jgi:N-acetylmuramoyl-L-alanine amidase